MKFLNFNRVLCLSPHPDDTEYSIAGVILKHCDTQFDILCLTQGGDCDTTTGPSRVQEVKNAWSQTTATNCNLHFSDVKFLKERGVDEWINYIETNFTIIEPQGYLEMIELLKYAKLVMTDSGGLQKEAYFFKKNCITLREQTEWVELVENGCAKICDEDPIKIKEAF
jgi:UDP-GlcNAc3NAcA epimerase